MATWLTNFVTKVFGGWAAALFFIASYFYSKRQAKKAQKEADRAAAQAAIAGTLVTSRGSSEIASVIIGTDVRFAGTEVYKSIGGPQNRYMFVIHAFARHALGAAVTVQIGEVELTDVKFVADLPITTPGRPAYDSWITVDGPTVGGADPQYKYYSNFRYKWFPSAANPGTCDADFLTVLADSGITDWTADHKMSGMAYLVMFFIWPDNGSSVWPQGQPNITIKTDGVVCPRVDTGFVGPDAATKNPVNHIYRFLKNTSHGLGCADSEIDTDNFTWAAQICAQVLGDGTSRYECNGIVSGDSKEMTLSKLLETCAGEISYSGGKWRVFPGAWRTPSLTLDEDDLRGPLEVSTSLSRRDKFNSVKGIFRDPSNGQPVDFPPIVVDSFVTSDGEQIWLENDLELCNSAETAQRVSYILLEKARQQISVKYSCSLKGIKAIVGDNIYVTNTRMGWSSKVFEVKGLELVNRGAEIGVDLELQETDATIFDDILTSGYDPSPNTNLPFPGQVDSPSALVVSERLARFGDVVSTIVTFSWTPPETPFTTVYEAKYYRNVSPYTEIYLAEGYTGSTLDVSFQGQEALLPSDYVFMVRAKNVIGAYSEWVSSAVTEIEGKTAPPPNPTLPSPSYVHSSSGTLLDWDDPLVTDANFLDWKETEVRKGIAWLAAEFVRRTKDSQFSVGFLSTYGLTSLTHTYFIAHYDTQPQVCLVPTQLQVLVEAPEISNLEARAVAGKALLTWTIDTDGSYGVKYYEIRKGSTYATSTFVANSNGPYAPVEELNSGTYTYWVTGYDPAGNYTDTLTVEVEVPPQPNFILLTTEADDMTTVGYWSGIFYENTNTYQDGKIYPLVDGTKTWADHWTDGGFATVADLLAAGHLYLFEPVENGVGEEGVYTWDITLSYAYPEVIGVIGYTRDVLNDDADWSFDIGVSADGITWTWFYDTTQFSYTQVKYIQVVVTMTDQGLGQSLIQPTGLTLDLNVAKTSENGKITYVTGAAGHTVTFGNSFIDIALVNASVLYQLPPYAGDLPIPGGSEEAVDLFIEFVDAPNPTSMNIILVRKFDGGVTTQDHKVAWNVEGY